MAPAILTPRIDIKSNLLSIVITTIHKMPPQRLKIMVLAPANKNPVSNTLKCIKKKALREPCRYKTNIVAMLASPIFIPGTAIITGICDSKYDKTNPTESNSPNSVMSLVFIRYTKP